ncbi:MAG: hypothetical protein EXS36_04495 [Pedosphaera sp.]|nr:hypothetical protein [Pedosphaera sp.]
MKPRETRTWDRAKTVASAVPLLLLTLTATTVSGALYLNCGGTNGVTDSVGRSWEPDKSFLVSSNTSIATFQPTNVVDASLLSDRSIPNEVLLHQRWKDGDLRYEIPVLNGPHTVILYFSENCAACVNSNLGGNGPVGSARVFNVEVEGRLRNDYNPADAARGLPNDGLGTAFKATQVIFTNVLVADSILNITIQDRGPGNPPENATISAMAILQEPTNQIPGHVQIAQIRLEDQTVRLAVDPLANLPFWRSGLVTLTVEVSTNLIDWMPLPVVPMPCADPRRLCYDAPRLDLPHQFFRLHANYTGGPTVYALAVPMVFEVNMGVISDYTLDLPANRLVTFRTTDLSPGSDPVMHLLDVNGYEVAVDDNSGPGSAAWLTYTPSTSGNYRVVVRARSNTTAGSCNLTKDGTVWQTGVAFAGSQVSLPQLRANETLETVKVPNGAQGTHLLFVLKSDGVGIELRGYGNGTTGAAALALAGTLGNRTAVVGVNRWAVPGAARFIRNDVGLAGHDPDHDGLGHELEIQLGTCDSLTGFATGPDGVPFNCRLATDPRDTDGDGISDGWEVLGRRDMWPHQALPLWGANPRHKDLFVEFDFMQRSPGEAEVKMTAANARKFAAYYGDQIGTASPFRQAYRAAVLRNPDGKPGIRAHLDIGVVPTDPADATIFGDWGGHNVIPPVTNAEGDWGGVDYHDVWRTHLSPARRGIFRHSPAPASGGGSNTENYFSFSAGLNEPWVLAHESGHANGLGHSGPSGITGVADPNCKPNYQSLMNYAYQSAPDQIGFSDGLDTGVLNNTALTEWEAVPPSNTSYLELLQKEFLYYVDETSGHVDWNRDGVFAPAGTTVRAYANYRPGGGGCEWTRYNAVEIGGTSGKSPAIARLGNRTYVFWASNDSVWYTWSTSSFNCPVPDITPCGTVSGRGRLALDATQGLDAIPIGSGSQSRILLVGTSATGVLRDVRLSLLNAGFITLESWTIPAVIASGAAASGEPSLVRLDASSAHLAFKGTDGKLRMNRTGIWNSWGWEGDAVQVSSTGVEVTLAANASPTIARAYLPYKPGIPALYGAFASAVDGRLDIWWWNNGTGRWEKTAVLERRPGPIRARPAMAWVPTHHSSEFPGRFYLLYVADGSWMMQWMMSYVKVIRNADGSVTKAEKVGLEGPFDNVWAVAAGVDLLYEEGVDTNLRAVTTGMPTDTGLGAVWMRPKADGIQDFNLLNYNDWQVLRVGICQQLVNPGGTVSNPIKCPPKDW